MTAYIIRRVLWFVPVLFTVGLVTFLIARATPGGPFDRDPTRRQIPASTQRVLNAKFGLDLPVWRQFTRYMFFDIETDPLRQLCYLHGFVIREGGDIATERFEGIFARDITDEAEREAFANAMVVFRRHAGALVVHYSKYEHT